MREQTTRLQMAGGRGMSAGLRDPRRPDSASGSKKLESAVGTSLAGLPAP